MTAPLKKTFFIMLLGILTALSLTTEASRPDRHKEVKANDLLINREKYRNKYVKVEMVFKRFHMPGWGRRSGMSEKKYYWMIFNPDWLQVVARKRDFDNAEVLKLKPRMKVLLCGKLKRMSLGRIKKYYLDLDKFEIISDQEKKKEKKEKSKQAAESSNAA